MTMVIWLAATTPPVPPGTHIPKPDTVSPGFAGFLTIFLLTVATIILIRSMVKHMRKVRYSPDPAAPPPVTAPAPEGSGPPM
jgi:hypothetical protein